ncbi:hypothetical protein LCGC14_3006420, partial [marine sediment metagenome]
FMGISSQLGQYSAMCLPILLYISPFLVVIAIFTLFAAKSVSAILALIVGAIFFCWHKRYKLVIIPIVIAVIALGFFYRGSI